MIRLLMISLVVFFQLPNLGEADSIQLKSGKTLRGKILPREGLQVLVRTKEGLVTLHPSEILGVQYDEGPLPLDPQALQLYRQRSVQIASGDVQSRFELAQFCLNAGLYEEAAREFRALIPSAPDQTEELQRLIQRSEEAAFRTLLTQASWWGRVAHQESKALGLIESAQTRYPEYAEKTSLKEILYHVQKEMESRLYLEKTRKARVLWTTSHFKVYATHLVQAKGVGELCEEVRLRICQVLGLAPDEIWKSACEVFIFEKINEYLEVSGAKSWSSGASRIVFELDMDGVPVIHSRTIMVYLDRPPSLAEASRGGQEAKRILAHEIAHLLLQDLLGATSLIPTWISEGFATYTLSDELKGGRIEVREPIPLEALTQMKAYPPFERVFYEQSELLTRFLIEKGGMEKFLTLAYLLGAGTSLEAALKEVYPRNFKDIQKLAERLSGARGQE